MSLDRSLSSFPPMIHTTVSTSVAESDLSCRVGIAPHAGARLQYIPVVGAGGASLSWGNLGMLLYLGNCWLSDRNRVVVVLDKPEAVEPVRRTLP